METSLSLGALGPSFSRMELFTLKTLRVRATRNEGDLFGITKVHK